MFKKRLIFITTVVIVLAALSLMFAVFYTEVFKMRILNQRPEEQKASADMDSDDDALSDLEENSLGTNKNSADTDGDGLGDANEVRIYNTDPKNADPDNDKLTDYYEIIIYETDPFNPDSDSDGISDYDEALEKLRQKK
ncbi:hypothetical protein C4572_02560 [Candidatus Parcubacteria bacterium]|nr:MAG: hypothetical protein C4572_02560 [Candidatus Parcubacteria bacterium]